MFPDVSLPQLDLEIILVNLLDLFDQLDEKTSLSISSQEGRKFNELHFQLKGPNVNNILFKSPQGLVELKVIKTMLESKNGTVSFEKKKDTARIILKMPNAA